MTGVRAAPAGTREPGSSRAPARWDRHGEADLRRLRPCSWTTSSSRAAGRRTPPTARRSRISHEAGPDRHGDAPRLRLPKAGGCVIVRKAVDLTLPENYAFTFQLRGEAARNNFEFKLVDPAGKNVWWRVQRDFRSRRSGRRSRSARRASSSRGARRGAPKRVGAIEIAISGGNGGKGTVWIDACSSRSASLRASTGARRRCGPRARSRGTRRSARSTTSRRSAGGARPARSVARARLRRQREYGGLRIDWDPEDYAAAFRVEISDDGADGARLGDARRQGRARLRLPAGGGVPLRAPGAGEEQPRPGLRHLGGPRAAARVLRHAEPVLRSDRRGSAARHVPEVLHRRADVLDGGRRGRRREERASERGGHARGREGSASRSSRSSTSTASSSTGARCDHAALEDGYLPIPSVRWEGGDVALHVTAFAAGEPGASTLYASYRVENRRAEPTRARLFLAVRPFQVDPPWQSLNMVGGVAPIHTIRFDGGAVWVNRDEPVILGRPPDRSGPPSIERGSLTDFLQAGGVPPQTAVADRFGFASAAARYDLTSMPGAKPRSPWWCRSIPATPRPAGGRPHARGARPARRGAPRLGGAARARRASSCRSMRRASSARSRARSATSWSIATARPPARVARLRALVDPRRRAHLVGAPRDGLHARGARVHRWFAPYQLPDGKVPCCVDRRGADPVPEHDSNGEFVFAVAEYYRYTRDVGFLSDDVAARRARRRLPRSRCGASARTDEYRAPTSARSSACCRRRSATRATPPAGALVLGRFLRAARVEGRRRRSPSPRRRRARRELRRAPRRRSAPISTPRSRARIERPLASTTFPARPSSATSIRPRRRSRSIRAASWRTCRARRSTHVREVLRGVPRAHDDPRELGRLHALRAAQRRSARAPRPARRGARRSSTS